MALPPESRTGPTANEWSRYRDNLARHLIGLARDVQLRLMTHLVETRGHRALRPSFGALIQQIARAPQPLSQLARALAVSPQAASQLVALAEDAGYLARQSTPSDRRTRLARLTPTGERLVRDALASLDAIESDLRARIGEADYRRFGLALARLTRDLELVPMASDARSGSSAGLLPVLANHVEQTLMQTTSARGHAGLKLSHGQILPLVGPSGVRLHQLASLHGVSRQAISAIARDLEALDYLRRERDLRDGRGVVVRLTPRGTRLIADSVRALDALDADWRARLGTTELATFARSARTLYASLGLESEVLSGAFALGRGDSVDEASTVASTTSPPRPRRSTRALRSSQDERPPHRRTRDEPDALVLLAARLRDRLGSRDAARLAAHLTAGG